MYCSLAYVSKGGLPLKTLVLYIYRPRGTMQYNQQSYSHSILLIVSYEKTATNKWLLIFETRGDSNRCTPCRGKPDQYDTYAFHTISRMPGLRFLWAVPVHGNLSRGTDRFGQIPLLPRKMAPDIIYSTPVDRSMGPYLASLLNQPMKQGA
jgi:hypothetical protein